MKILVTLRKLVAVIIIIPADLFSQMFLYKIVMRAYLAELAELLCHFSFVFGMFFSNLQLITNYQIPANEHRN